MHRARRSIVPNLSRQSYRPTKLSARRADCRAWRERIDRRGGRAACSVRRSASPRGGPAVDGAGPIPRRSGGRPCRFAIQGIRRRGGPGRRPRRPRCECPVPGVASARAPVRRERPRSRRGRRRHARFSGQRVRIRPPPVATRDGRPPTGTAHGEGKAARAHRTAVPAGPPGSAGEPRPPAIPGLLRPRHHARDLPADLRGRPGGQAVPMASQRGCSPRVHPHRRRGGSLVETRQHARCPRPGGACPRAESHHASVVCPPGLRRGRCARADDPRLRPRDVSLFRVVQPLGPFRVRNGVPVRRPRLARWIAVPVRHRGPYPATPYEEGIRRTMDWFRSHRATS